jgi:hypothetical protein
MRARRLSCAGEEHTIARVFLRAIDPSGPSAVPAGASRVADHGDQGKRQSVWLFLAGLRDQRHAFPARIFLPTSFAAERAVKRARAGPAPEAFSHACTTISLSPALRRASRPADFCRLGLA